MEWTRAVYISKMRVTEEMYQRFKGEVYVATDVAGAYMNGKTLTVFAVLPIQVDTGLSDIAAEARGPILKILGILSCWYDIPLDIQWFQQGRINRGDVRELNRYQNLLVRLPKAQFLEQVNVARKLLDLEKD